MPNSYRWIVTSRNGYVQDLSGTPKPQMCLTFRFLDSVQLLNWLPCFSMFFPKQIQLICWVGTPETNRKPRDLMKCSPILQQDESGLEIDFYSQAERWKLRSVVTFAGQNGGKTGTR